MPESVKKGLKQERKWFGKSAAPVKKGRPRGSRTRATAPVGFSVDMVYTLEQAAAILQRSEEFIRKICRMNRIAHNKDSSGIMIGGWSIKQYVSGICPAAPGKDKGNEQD